MPTIISDSTNVSSFDISILGDTCAGVFQIDAIPTVYIGSGAASVLGINVKITNPLGVVIKDYTTSGYDLEAGSSDVVEVDIPTEAGNYQYGNYIIDATLYDEDGTEYEIQKSVYLSAPNSKNKTKKYGTITATILGYCSAGKAVIQISVPPNYRGFSVESQDSDFTLDFPSGSGEDSLDVTANSFSVQLYEGTYKIAGETCATYNYGDNITVKVNYKLKYEKRISCLLNEECLGIKLSGYYHKLLFDDCNDTERAATSDLIAKIVGLAKAIQSLSAYNNDASELINELEELLDCSCTDETEGTPIINNAPATDVIVQGVNVDSETSGLTTTYTIDNYDYEVQVTANGGILTINTPMISGNSKIQTLFFNSAPLYTIIKSLANASDGEGIFWASVVNKGINAADPTSIGLDNPTWLTLTLLQRVQAILDAFLPFTGGTLTGTLATFGSVGDILDYDNQSRVLQVYSAGGTNDAFMTFEMIGYLDRFGLHFADNNFWRSRHNENSVEAAALDQNYMFFDTKTLLFNTDFKTTVAGENIHTISKNKTPQTLTDGATITWNFALGYNTKVTLGGNRTLAITNVAAGDEGRIEVTQDGTGSRTLTLPAGSTVSGGGGGAITLTATAGATDVLKFYYNGTNYRWTKDLNFT